MSACCIETKLFGDKFCGCVTETTREDYKKVMGQDGVYGGHVEMVIICEE
jgi:hypothetical protein